ncbi:hypothetical protein V2G26_002610 [Clonostachys chloroleuca]
MSTPTYPGVVPPPPGIIPNLTSPKDSGWTLLLGWLITCNVFTTLAFITRAYVKVWIVGKILLEDVTFTIASIIGILYSATVAGMLYYGEGRHAWELSPEAYKNILRWLYFGSVVYSPAAYFTKVTILLIIARIFIVRERVTMSIYIFIAALLVSYLPIQFTKTFICSPIKAFWDDSVKGTCLNQRRIFIADTTLSFLTDFIILTIPIPLIWSLKTPLCKKIQVAALLGAGGIATAVTCFRLWAVVQFIHSTDASSDFVRQSICVLIELTIGLLCSCLPAANILIERYKSDRSSASQNSSAPRCKWLFMKHSHNSQPPMSEPSEPQVTVAASNASTLGGPLVDVDVELAMMYDLSELSRGSYSMMARGSLASARGDRYFTNPRIIEDTTSNAETSSGRISINH